eukprot:TRINITY_DN2892_c0_g1_i1.p1 TRINITY_DN2892_c0_g1~~TRINITY_DN2892_c0_g1_i1.p1  ORF type:complete len:435 (-),score=87.48 TRINITY_DN2892_c0_g1_i1:1078-2382(-)
MEVGSRRVSPAKPWERGGSATTVRSPSTTTAVERPTSASRIPRPISSTNDLSTTARSNALGRPGSSALGTRPGLQRPWESGGYGGSSYGGGYGGGYGGSSYGGSSYGGGYGGGYNSYGRGGYSSYGGYGSYGGGYGSYGTLGRRDYGRGMTGYSGYGGGYGGGYGSYGGYGGYGMQRKFGEEFGPSDRYLAGGFGWVRDFQGLADGFARFSNILDANFDALYGSFSSVAQLLEHFSNLRREIFYAFQAFTVFGIIRKIWSSWFGMPVPKLLSGNEKGNFDMTSFKKFEENANQQPASRPMRALMLLFVLVGGPLLLAKLAKLSLGVGSSSPEEELWNDERPKIRALRDFQGETPEELSFRQGDIMLVLGEPFEGWLEVDNRERRGLVPAEYVEVVTRDQLAGPKRGPRSLPPPTHDKYQEQEPFTNAFESDDVY